MSSAKESKRVKSSSLLLLTPPSPPLPLLRTQVTGNGLLITDILQIFIFTDPAKLNWTVKLLESEHEDSITFTGRRRRRRQLKMTQGGMPPWRERAGRVYSTWWASAPLCSGRRLASPPAELRWWPRSGGIWIWNPSSMIQNILVFHWCPQLVRKESNSRS